MSIIDCVGINLVVLFYGEYRTLRENLAITIVSTGMFIVLVLYNI
jgi:hypothetical protein